MKQHPDSPAVKTATPSLAPAADSLGPALLPETANALVAEAAPAPPASRDAHGFDPNDYEWIPVLRKRRVDGWSPQAQRTFIETLADCGSITVAATAVGMSPGSCYRPGARRGPKASPPPGTPRSIRRRRS